MNTYARHCTHSMLNDSGKSQRENDRRETAGRLPVHNELCDKQWDLSFQKEAAIELLLRFI